MMLYCSDSLARLILIYTQQGSSRSLLQDAEDPCLTDLSHLSIASVYVLEAAGYCTAGRNLPHAAVTAHVYPLR